MPLKNLNSHYALQKLNCLHIYPCIYIHAAPRFFFFFKSRMNTKPAFSYELEDIFLGNFTFEGYIQKLKLYRVAHVNNVVAGI